MASKKKESEGMALLSMYGEEDDEMEDAKEPDENIREEEIGLPYSNAFSGKYNDESSCFANQATPLQQEAQGLNDNFSPYKPLEHGSVSATASPAFPFVSPQLQQQTVVSDVISVQIQKTRLTIVDYGHEEGAMSPEAEDGEIIPTGRVTYGEQLQITYGEMCEKKSPGRALLLTPDTHATTSPLDPIDHSESVAVSYTINISQSVEDEDVIMVSLEDQKEVDPLDKFLPPPPKTQCSEELQEKIRRFLLLKKTGRSFNAEVRNRKEYRNPDFLLHAVTYQDIDQIGSCFSKDVFDLHGYDSSDFYDEIEFDMRRESERREQEKKKTKMLEFGPGGTQSNINPTPKINLPIPGMATAGSANVLNVTPAAVDATARDERQNKKKSKWDKVVDQRNSLSSGCQETLSGVGAHAATLSAKAGSGYSAFAQQKKKEAATGEKNIVQKQTISTRKPLQKRWKEWIYLQL